jgi:AcrR family transcriptional regulator
VDKQITGTDLKWHDVLMGAIGRGLVQTRAPQQTRSRERHAEILRAAVRVFARDGIARARISDIAAEAGVPLSSVYDYYGSKEEIAYVVPIARMGEFFAEFASKAHALDTARERLSLFLWLTVDFARRNQDWARTLYLEVWPSVLIEKTPVKESLDDYGRILLALISDGEHSAEWPPDRHPYQTVTIFIGSTSQLIITWLLYKKPRHLMKATMPLVERLLSILQPVTEDLAAGLEVTPVATTAKARRPARARARHPEPLPAPARRR